MEPFERIDSAKSNLPTKNRRAAYMVSRFMRRSDDYRKPHLEQARRARETYVCWNQITKSTIQRANLQLPYGYTLVETELPQLFNAFEPGKPLFKFNGKKPQSRLFQETLTDFHQDQLSTIQFPVKWASFLKGMVIDGTAIAKVPYKYREQVVNKRVIKQDSETGGMFYDKEPQLQVIQDGPDFEHVALHDFFPDWRVKVPGAVQQMRGCVHRMRKTFQELKANEKKGGSGIYSNLDEVELSVQIKGYDQAWNAPYWDTEAYREYYDRSRNNEPGSKDREQLEIWEYWGLFDPNDDGKFEEYIITVVNGDVVIRCDKNFYDFKFKPFIAAINVLQDNEFYGLSELVAVRGLVKEGQQLRNSRLDQINLSINRMWLVDRTAGIKTKSLYMRPNGIVFTNAMEGIKLLEAPEIPASALREDQEISADIQSATGQVNTPAQASNFNKALARSATGVQKLDSFASSRVSLKLVMLSEITIKPLAHIMFMTNRQFITDDQFVQMTDPDRIDANGGNPFTVLPVFAFDHDYDFDIVTSSDDGGPQQEYQNLTLFAQYAQTAEATQPGIINWEPLMESIGKALLGRQVSRFIRTPQEMQQMQAQNLAMQNAVNAMQGQRAPQPNAGGGAPMALPPGGTK